MGYEQMRDACIALSGTYWMGYFQQVLVIKEAYNAYQAVLPEAQKQLYAAQQDLSYWDVIVGYAGPAYPQTVRMQIEGFKELLVKMGWSFIDPV